MQFGPLNVHLSPNTTYAFVWDLDSVNTNITAGQTPDIYEDIWITGDDPTLQGGGAAGGQICVIQAPNAVAATPNQAIPNQGLVTYNSPAQTYSMTFDLGIVPLSLSGGKTTPTITTAPTASAITYGQALTSSTLNGGLASVPGSFAFTTPSTIRLRARPRKSVTFTPADTNDYNTVTLNVSVTVNKATPTITTAPTASAITYGQALSSSTLNGGLASVPGSFAFTTAVHHPDCGQGLAKRDFYANGYERLQRRNAQCECDGQQGDADDYRGPNGQRHRLRAGLVQLHIERWSWFSVGQLCFYNAVHHPDCGHGPAKRDFYASGHERIQHRNAQCECDGQQGDADDYHGPNGQRHHLRAGLVQLHIERWSRFSVGSFAFTTPSTIPTAGTAPQSVTFTPADTNEYNTVTLNVSVTVNKATPTIITAPTASPITYGQALSSSTLSGGVASVPGSFAFTTPSSIPSAARPRKA